MISGYPRGFADSVGLRRLLITDKSVKDAAAKQYAATALTDFLLKVMLILCPSPALCNRQPYTSKDSGSTFTVT